MIKLSLPSSMDFQSVKVLPGLHDVELDKQFGLVSIDQQQSLYVVRAEFVDRLDERKAASPEIVDAYGDIRISSL